MKRCLCALLALLTCCGASFAAISAAPAPGWSPGQIVVLRHWVAAAPEDGLPVLPTGDLDHALASANGASANGASANGAAVDTAATALALRLARMHLLGSTRPADGLGWHLSDSDASIDLPVRLAEALGAASSGSGAGSSASSSGALERFFAGLRPQHPDYAALRAAYATEKDPARRATLALNMERWRWLPASLGQDYILVNTAAFEVSLWRQGRRLAVWPVIVGKAKTPTPAFSARVTGVTYNPWWDVPANIAPEVARLMRRRPALARQRGYVVAGGRYRQRPGPANSLGQMKLAMANPFDIYLHDTPEKRLFARDVRAFSHGCIRVSDALGFAATVLQGVRTPEEIAAIVATGHTTTVALAAPLPVYVTYFTAGTRQDGALVMLPDIYGRDRALK